MAYVLVMTPEVRAWLHDVRKRDRATAIQVGQAIGMLLEAGPELGRPLADRVHHSRLSNLKELRPGSGRAQRDPHPVYLRSAAERGPAGSRGQGW
jgi:hypothetical protein